MIKAIQESKLEEILSKAEQIGALSSPSTNALLNINLLEDAEKRNLVGNFCVMPFQQDHIRCISVGQIKTITLRNPYLERHSIQKIVSVRGQAPPLTGQHDVRLVEMSVGAVYGIRNGSLEPSTLGSLPQTGSSVYLLNREVMETLLEPFLEESFFVGKLYNTDYLLPTIFKHFGSSDGGLGEAYHIGIFGKTGSGKSFLAKMILSAYSKRTPMSILVIDPQGEFSKELKSETALVSAMKAFKRDYSQFDISQLALTTSESFERLLKVSNFVREMSVSAEANQENALRLFRNIFNGTVREQAALGPARERISFSNSSRREIFDRIMNLIVANIRAIYVSQQEQNRVIDIIRTEGDRLFNLWRRFALLFSSENRTSIQQVVSDVCDDTKIIFLNLSEDTAKESLWNDSVLAVFLREIFYQLQQKGTSKYRTGAMNLLVCIDEAHRFAPRETPVDEDFGRLKASLLDAVKTTRKYGLGWMFISQTLASIDSEILKELRLYFFGYGLSWGSELRTLREIVGGRDDDAAIELYQSFKDPQTAAIMGKREYPFMAFGPVSVLSVSGSPIFFIALNYFNEFLKENNIAISRTKA